MRITRKRINRVSSYLDQYNINDKICIGIDSGAHISKLNSVGFKQTLAEGDSILPSAIGPVSSFNANGTFIKLVDQPKETKYRYTNYGLAW